MGLNDVDIGLVHASSASPSSGPSENLSYTGAGGAAGTENGRESDFSSTACQQLDVAIATSRELAPPSSPVLTYGSKRQHGQQEQLIQCQQQHCAMQLQLQNVQSSPVTGWDSRMQPERRVNTGSPLLASVSGSGGGMQPLTHSQRQSAGIFLQQQSPPPVCQSSRASPIGSTPSTPPLPQVHATGTNMEPSNSYVPLRGTSPTVKDLSALLAAVGGSSGSSRGIALLAVAEGEGKSTVAGSVPLGAGGLPVAVSARGARGGPVSDRQEEENRTSAAAAAAASMQALHQLMQNGGCLMPLAEPWRHSIISADRALQEPSATEGAEAKNCQNVIEEEKQMVQQSAHREGCAPLVECTKQLEDLNLSSGDRVDTSQGQQQGNTETLLGSGRRGVPSFEDLLSQVHKLLRSNSTSSASSASTPRGFCSARPHTAAPHTPQTKTPRTKTTHFSAEGGEATIKQRWDSKQAEGTALWRHDSFEDDSRKSAAVAETRGPGSNRNDGNVRLKTGFDDEGPPSPTIDLAVLQAVAASVGANSCRSQGGASPFGDLSSGLVQSKSASNMEFQTILMLPELHRQAVQQRAAWVGSRAAEGECEQESDFLQNTLEMLKEGRGLAQQEPQVAQQAHQAESQQHQVPTLQLSPPERRRGLPQSVFPSSRSPVQRASSGRLLAPTYQTYDQIQSAPNPSTPIIRGNNKISVEQFLMSFPFTRTADYTHAVLKFCADHNLVVKLLGYHGKRVELLERQYCCRIQTSAQAASFPGYPNGRCVLFTGCLTSLLRACSDLYAVVDTSSPGLRTNIEGYRICLVVPGDFVGRLLRCNCAGLRALQEVGGRSVHIALGNLCVVMRGNYSERVLLIDGNLESVCQVLEFTAAQLQDFLRRYGGSPGPTVVSPQSLLTRYEFLDYPKRIELHLST